MTTKTENVLLDLSVPLFLLAGDIGLERLDERRELVGRRKRRKRLSLRCARFGGLLPKDRDGRLAECRHVLPLIADSSTRHCVGIPHRRIRSSRPGGSSFPATTVPQYGFFGECVSICTQGMSA